MKLTRADLIGRKMTNAVHFRIDRRGGGNARSFGVEGLPRLTCWEQGGKRTWAVDGTALPSLDSALAVLNGEKTVEKVMAEEAAKRKFSIDAQIAEVEYELQQRKAVYPGIARKSPQRQSQLEEHYAIMEGVLATLQFVKENADDFRAWHAQKKNPAPAEAGAYKVEPIDGGFKLVDGEGCAPIYVYGRETKVAARQANMVTLERAQQLARAIAEKLAA